MDEDRPKIGKNVIESLTLGMYEDSRFIYREYIQNAADQIDKAVQAGLLAEGEGRIDIEIDENRRTITIEDNATGIASDKFEPTLRNIAYSKKDRSEDKGFRGIGRLGGLAYCSKLIFETTAKGECVRSKMTWDANKLKDRIYDFDVVEDATSVIEQITYTEKFYDENPDTHYFKVTLQGVRKPEIKSQVDLLDPTSVREYLSMVAPVEISSDFAFKAKIDNFVRGHNLKADTYSVRINGRSLYKEYTTNVYKPERGGNKSPKVYDEIRDVVFLLKRDKNGDVLYWGWYTLCGFKGQFPSINNGRGIRLRKGNIQLGDEEICKKFFANTSDQRFSFYFFGEIHAVHKELIPNSRRDYFIENDTLTQFEQEIGAVFENLRKLCYYASKRNKAKDCLEERERIKSVIRAKEQEGYTSSAERTQLMKRLQAADEKYHQAKTIAETYRVRSIDSDDFRPASAIGKLETLIPISEEADSEPTTNDRGSIREPLVGTTIGVKSPVSSVKYVTDKPIYGKYTTEEKCLILKIYDVIYKTIADEGLREALVKAIERELTK